MRTRLLALLALLLVAGALSGVSYSSASFTDLSHHGVSIGAAADWTPPEVSVDDPGDVLSGTVTISATASDATSAIARVEIQYVAVGSTEWNPLCADHTAPWACGWTTTEVADGDFLLRAVATDVAGNSRTSDVVATAVRNETGPVDRTPPTVALQVAPGTLVGPVELTATASDEESGVASVTFEYRLLGTLFWTTCGVDTTAPYSCTVDTALLGDLLHEFRAVARDRAGNTTTTPTQSRLVDNHGPLTTLTVPPGHLGGTVRLNATAVDVSGVASVTFQHRPAGSETWLDCGTDTTAPYSCDLATASLANGAWELRAVGTDALGLSASSPVESRTVANASTITVTDPLAGSAVRGLVTVTASAASTLGVAQVAFSWREQGNAAWTACGPGDTTAPYACAWDTTVLADGAYELRAELTDGSGGSATSATVAVVVRRLRGYDVQGTPVPNGVAGVGDTLTLTYSGLVDLDTVRAGWTGPATTSPVVLHHQNDGTPLIQGRDYLSFATDVNLGEVAFAQNFINSQSATFGAATMTADTVTVDGVPATRITIALGAPTSGGQRLRSTSNTGTTQWTPSAVAADSSGTPCAVTTVDESGITDADL